VIPELRPRGVGEVLDAAVLLYRARFGALMRVAVLVVVPIQVLSLLVLLSALPDDYTIGFTGETTPVYDSDTDTAIAFAAALVTIVLSALATTFVSAATTRIVAEAYVGRRDGSVNEAMRDTLHRFLPLIGLTLLVTAGVTIGLFLCVVPGLWLQTAWCLAVPVFVLEGTKVTRAIGRSFELTKQRFWLAFGVFWLSQLLITALTFGLTAATTWLVRTGDSLAAETIVQSVASGLASVITIPFAAAALVALYFDFRIRAEAFDVQMMIARLDEGRAPDTMPA
jgi:hypothetical protein